MRVLLDECLPHRLKHDLAGQVVRTVPEMGWAGKRNGELLLLASSQFDVFVTVDRNLQHQQNLPTFNIAIIVLSARGNRLSDLRPLVPRMLDILTTAPTGQVTIVEG